MLKHTLKTVFIILTNFVTLQAQEVNYDDVYFKYTIPALSPELQAYKTFDLTFANEITNFWGDKKTEILNFKPEFDHLTQVESSDDLHVFCRLYHIKVKKDKEKRDVYDIDLHTVITNKYGTKLYEEHLNADDIPYGANVSNNKFGIKYNCVEQAISISLVDFTRLTYGYAKTIETSLAKLDGVKKKTEFAGLEDQVKLLSKYMGQGAPEFVKAAEQYVPFWEKLTQYSEGKEPNEVKRAGYQNLSVYYILANKIDKAQTILEEYKKVDKQVKIMFGLIKYKNSDKCDSLISLMNPKPVEVDEKKGGTEILSKSAILDRVTFTTIEGTVRIKDKKIGGTYTGTIKVRSIASLGKTGGMLNLDATDIEMFIIPKDKNGKDTIRTVISKIEELTDNTGKKYIAQKFSNAIGFVAGAGVGNWGLMMVSYESPKVSVYRCIVPTTYSEDYVVRKAGDDKGMRSGGLLGFKKLTDYLSDCPEIAEQVKAGQIDRKTTPEKLAEQYSNSSQSGKK
jgi:hypothetical protein